MKEVFSSGGGTQSSAIAALILQGRLPRPDFMCIADTGREMPTTWTYLDEVVNPALKKAGMQIERIGREYVLESAKNIFNSQGTLILPVFIHINGGLSKASAFCSSGWKTEVVNRWLKQKYGLKRPQMRKWIGFSFDETKRVLRMQEGKEYKRGLIYLPLVDLRIKRQMSREIVRQMGWPDPPRSRCFDCPNQTDREWAEVKANHPEEFKASIARDEYIRTRDPRSFLHSSGKPLKDADLQQEDDLFSGGCASGECFT